jgi:hypothetical protein
VKFEWRRCGVAARCVGWFWQLFFHKTNKLVGKLID